MNLESLKAEQATLSVMASAQSDLANLWAAFQADIPRLSASIIVEFSKLGLIAEVDSSGTYVTNKIDVKVHPSPRRITIHAYARLEFNTIRRRPEYPYFDGGPGYGPGYLPMQTPVVLPVTVKASSAGGPIEEGAAIRWLEHADNVRLASIVADLFVGHKGPNEFIHGSDGPCFVATVVFGEDSEEVALLRRWRNECLSGSLAGRVLIAAYYELGPLMVAAVRSVPSGRRLVRRALSAFCSRIVERSREKRPN